MSDKADEQNSREESTGKVQSIIKGLWGKSQKSSPGGHPKMQRFDVCILVSVYTMTTGNPWPSVPVLVGSFCAAAALIVVRQSRKAAPGRDWKGIAPGYHVEGPAKNGFSKKKVPTEVDVIVIGSGLGGLVAANLLAQQGKRVLVLEQHDVAGGCTHSFMEKGYEFDVGLHYVGADCGNPDSEVRKLFDTVTEGGVEWYDCSAANDECYDEAMLLGRKEAFPMHRGKARIEAELCARFPSEKEGIRRYFVLLAAAQDAAVPIFVAKLLPKWLARLVLPLVSANFANLAGRTVAEVLQAEVTRSVELAGVLAYCWGDYGSAPHEASFFHHALIAQHYFQGSYYPVGGPAQLARCASIAIEENGGAVLVRASVDKILVGSGGGTVSVEGVVVRGHTVLAPVVIAACGLRRTLSSLLPEQVVREHFPEAQTSLGLYQKEEEEETEQVQAAEGGADIVKPSASLATLFVALEGDFKQLGLTASNLWVFPSWDHSANSMKYTTHTEQPAFAVCPPSAVFVSCSTAKDPSSSERIGANKTSVTVICPVENSWYAKYEPGSKIKHRGHDYNALKEQLTQDLLTVLYGVCPNTRGKVQFTELGTSITNNFYLGVGSGEVYGIDCTTNRWNTAHQRTWARSDTPVRGLYLSGQDVFSPGITGAALSGLWAAAAVAPKVIWDHLGCFARM